MQVSKYLLAGFGNDEMVSTKYHANLAEGVKRSTSNSTSNALESLLLKLKFDRFDAYGATREQIFATHTHIRG